MIAPTFDGAFPHNWTAEILPQRPMILPSRHYVYPGVADEVERGALEVLVQPKGYLPAEIFLATCALGFRDSATPTGIWSMPDPDWLCAVSGGYAYLINVFEPERFTFLRYRPVLDIHKTGVSVAQSVSDEVQSASRKVQSVSGDLQSASNEWQSPSPVLPTHLEGGLLLFVGHHSILAWGRDGEAWESDRLSWEGITVDRFDGHVLHGHGWDLMTDKDLPFALDLRTGRRLEVDQAVDRDS
jgi:hypothetical protein